MTLPVFALDQFLPYRLSVASNAVSNGIAQSYRKRFGLKIAQWRLIAILAQGTAMTPQALVSATRMDKISVSRAAAALIDRGLVTATDHEVDGRSHLLSLSADGLALYSEILPLALATEARLLATLTLQERETLDTLLRRVEQEAQTLLALTSSGH